MSKASDARAYALQRAWAHTMADGIERGELPASEDERGMLAAILRSAADQPLKPPPKRRGSPGKLPDGLADGHTIAAMVRIRELGGEAPADALDGVAGYFNVDEYTIGRICRPRRASVDDLFRGAHILGKKARRNSG